MKKITWAQWSLRSFPIWAALWFYDLVQKLMILFLGSICCAVLLLLLPMLGGNFSSIYPSVCKKKTKLLWVILGASEEMSEQNLLMTLRPASVACNDSAFSVFFFFFIPLCFSFLEMNKDFWGTTTGNVIKWPQMTYGKQMTVFLSGTNISEHIVRQGSLHCFYPSSHETGQEICSSLLPYFSPGLHHLNYSQNL